MKHMRDSDEEETGGSKKKKDKKKDKFGMLKKPQDAVEIDKQKVLFLKEEIKAPERKSKRNTQKPSDKPKQVVEDILPSRPT